MAEGDQSASAAQARSLSGSKHIGQWLLSKVLDKYLESSLCFDTLRNSRRELKHKPDTLLYLWDLIGFDWRGLVEE